MGPEEGTSLWHRSRGRPLGISGSSLGLSSAPIGQLFICGCKQRSTLLSVAVSTASGMRLELRKRMQSVCALDSTNAPGHFSFSPGRTAEHGHSQRPTATAARLLAQLLIAGQSQPRHCFGLASLLLGRPSTDASGHAATSGCSIHGLCCAFVCTSSVVCQSACCEHTSSTRLPSRLARARPEP